MTLTLTATLTLTLAATLTRCARNLRGAPPTDAASRAALRSHVVCGCNFPPSQFQLHLQFFLMPWLPSHYKAFTAGAALTHRRWFPVKYIKGLLSLNQPMAVELDTALDEIFAVFDSQLSYDLAFEQEVARSSSIPSSAHSVSLVYSRRRLRAPRSRVFRPRTRPWPTGGPPTLRPQSMAMWSSRAACPKARRPRGSSRQTRSSCTAADRSRPTTSSPARTESLSLGKAAIEDSCDW